MRSLLAALLLAGWPLMAAAIEEPAFVVVQTLEEVEIREYAPYVVAEVTLDTTADKAGSAAFPILAGYIFGANKGKQSLDMQAPVTQSRAPVKMAMTAPVTQSASGQGQAVRFVLPRTIDLRNAPEPDDPRVSLRQVASHRLAALRYSGSWSASNDREHLERLQTVLRKAGITWQGEPVIARYDPPFKPWFMRRNEVWLYLP